MTENVICHINTKFLKWHGELKKNEAKVNRAMEFWNPFPWMDKQFVPSIYTWSRSLKLPFVLSDCNKFPRFTQCSPRERIVIIDVTNCNPRERIVKIYRTNLQSARTSWFNRVYDLLNRENELHNCFCFPCPFEAFVYEGSQNIYMINWKWNSTRSWHLLYLCKKWMIYTLELYYTYETWKGSMKSCRMNF